MNCFTDLRGTAILFFQLSKLPLRALTDKAYIDLVVIDSYHHYRKLNELWYLITLQDLSPMQEATDVVLKVSLKPGIARSEYGREVYAVSKRQCNKKEIKFIMKKLTHYDV